MLKVRTDLRASPIHGIGLYAGEHIPKGTLVWRFCDRFNLRLSRREFAQLPTVQQSFLCHYGWIDQGDLGHWRVSLDDERFLNHSFAPNLCCDEGGDYATWSCRDIAAGEELLEDYTEFYHANDHQPFVIELHRQKRRVAAAELAAR